MIQGGIEGGLDDVFSFGDAHPAPLDSGFRRNDGSFAQVRAGGKPVQCKGIQPHTIHLDSRPRIGVGADHMGMTKVLQRSRETGSSPRKRGNCD